jgi:TonB family protein
MKLLAMFTSAQNAFRISTMRLAASGVVHVVVLGLLVTLRVDRALPKIGIRASHVVLVGPQISKVRPSAPRIEKTLPLRSVKPFSGAANLSPRPVLAEINLPEASPPAAVVVPTSIAITVPIALPAAPVIVGKLTAATADENPVLSSAITRSAGFEKVTQTAPSTRRSLVAQTGFGDASVRTKSGLQPTTLHSAITPVEILSKPRPVYTADARTLRIEGEILLEVLFAADGEPRVLRVIQGLGHGLEAAAVESASHIGFRPATRDGQPVDQIATVHILFQLVY